MIKVGSYHAKTHLPRLLKRVARGERITITRHGAPVAMLVPCEEKKGADRRSLYRTDASLQQRTHSREDRGS